MKFSDGYTQSISDFYWGYQSSYMTSCQEIKEKIENISENISKNDFKEKIETIRKEYMCSSRRYLVEFVKGLSDKIWENGSFDVQFQGEVYHFSGSGMSYIQEMETDEKNRFIYLLTQIALYNNEDIVTKEVEAEWELLFRKGMLSDDKVLLLNKSEICRIAHGLGFTLQMAEEYLVRTSDNDGFSFSSSIDLIEIFCFLHPGANNYHMAEKLKNQYECETVSSKEKEFEQKADYYTRMIQEQFPDLLKKWEGDLSRPTEEYFMEWLIAEAPQLDLASKTSRRIYSRLAMLAYHVITDAQFSEELYDEEITDLIMDYCEEEELPNESESYEITQTLLNYAVNSFDNKRIRNKRLYGTVWRYLTLNEKGDVKTLVIGNEIQELLQGKKTVTKADLLFLLWFVCELLWVFTREETEFYDQLSDFWTLSEDLLEECMLPAFYAPHMLEQSMLLSLCASIEEEETPFDLYEQMCELMNPIKHRNRKKKEQAEDEPSTKQLRKLHEAEIREAFKKGRCNYDGTEMLLLEHLKMYGAEDKQYIFEKEGISVYPNPEIVIQYPESEISARFDQSDSQYFSEDMQKERFEWLYSIYLYLREACKKEKIKLKCRINYRKNCMIHILEYVPGKQR